MECISWVSVSPTSDEFSMERLRQRAESEPDDQQLVQRCLAGDTQGFRELYRRHQQRVRSILYQLCDAAVLDDLVQEVFMRAWKGLPKFRQSAQFSTWLYRIAWNAASDQRQAAARGRDRLQVLTHHATTQQDAPDVMQLHYQDLVQRGLAALSFDHRTILVLHDLQEVPQKEVAEILAIPVGTVKSRLFHARAAMRQFLQKEGVQL
jgi:RNA polymerase sigma factor (sigma-70 family)